MPDMDTLLEQIATCEAQSDHDGARAAREALVAEHPDSEAVAEAAYKLGLDDLFRRRDLDAAVQRFKAAVDTKHPYWSKVARVSQGLGLLQQGRRQKAMFELSKVGHSTPPSMHSVTALTLAEQILRDIGNTEEAQRTRDQRIKQLRTLCAETTTEVADLAVFKAQLGLALVDSRGAGEALGWLEQAERAGADALGESLWAQVGRALAILRS